MSEPEAISKSPEDAEASSLASAWEATTETVSAVSEVVIDTVVDVGAAGVEMTVDAATRLASAIDDAIDEQAIKSAIVGAAETVGDKFDQVTGKQLVELLEERLRRQDEYNNILATRLAEALDRIASLEQRLGT